MPKELLPIIDKPVIQYAVEEAINAGCTELIFVTGRTKRAIEDHFDSNPELISNLRRQGKDVLADMVHSIIPENVSLIFTRQKEALGLGHAVRCASTIVGDEPALVLLADDYILPDPSCESPSQKLINAYGRDGGNQICVMPMPTELISRYGVIKPEKLGHGVMRIVEKPTPDKAPSNLAAIGRYLIEPTLMRNLETLKPGRNGEIQLTDALDVAAVNKNLNYVTLSGQRFDCGDKLGYLEAIMYSAMNNPKYAPDFIEMVSKALSNHGHTKQ